MLFSKGYTLILGVILLWATAFVLLVQLVLSTPWYGARFEADVAGKAMTIVSIVKDGPANVAGLEVGLRIVALEGDTFGRYDLKGGEAILGRHETKSFEEYNATLVAKDQVWPLLLQDRLVFVTDTGARYDVRPVLEPRISHLPFETVLKMGLALVVMLVAVGIWVFASPSFAVTLLAMSGLGLVTNMICGAVLSIHEIAILPSIFHATISVASWGSATFSYALLAVVLHFPRPMSRWPLAQLILGIGVLLQLNLLFQIVELPLNSFELSHLIPAPIALIASGFQWHNTRGRPLERASVMWISMTIYGLVTVVLLLYSLPVLLDIPLVIGPTWANVILALIFFGIALGTLRYRLFDVHRIWVRVIMWAIGGGMVVLADMVIVWMLGVDQSRALPLALLFAGWVYFPSRNKVMELLLGHRETNVIDHIPELIRRFNSHRLEDEVNGRFVGFLQSTYHVNEVASIDPIGIEEARIENHGLFMRVPLVSGERSVKLVGKANGRQLFSRSDVTSAGAFLRLVRALHEGNMREIQQLDRERKRITRDLHDDVGGKLLSLIYQAPDAKVAEQARGALQALRETVYVVEDDQSMEFEVAWNKLINEMATVLEHPLEQEGSASFGRDLSAREYVNLKRIFQEITSNALKYADLESFSVQVDTDENQAIQLTFRNRLRSVADALETSHRGLLNIKTRVEEMGGQLEIKDPADNGGVFELSLEIPAETVPD